MKSRVRKEVDPFLAHDLVRNAGEFSKYLEMKCTFAVPAGVR